MDTMMKALDYDQTMQALQAHPAARKALEAGVEILDVACDIRDRLRDGGVRTASTASTSTAGTGIDLAECNPVVKEVQALMRANCNQVLDKCWADMVAFTVGMLRSIPEVKDFIGRTKARLLVTGVTGSGVDAEGDPTTFVANFPVAPGESILLAMEEWPFVFPVECLFGALAFSGGDVEENYQQVVLQAFVGPRNSTPTSGNPGAPWNDSEVTYGSELRCGDNCKSVFLKGQQCGPASVGLLSQLRLVVTNKATASANITRQQLQIRMGGLRPYCCDACAVGGGACGCKG